MLSFDGLVAVCVIYRGALVRDRPSWPRSARGRQGALAEFARHLHAEPVDLHHGLDLLRGGRIGGAQRAGVPDDLPRADAGSSSGGSWLLRKDGAHRARAADHPRSPT